VRKGLVGSGVGRWNNQNHLNLKKFTKESSDERCEESIRIKMGYLPRRE